MRSISQRRHGDAAPGRWLCQRTLKPGEAMGKGDNVSTEDLRVALQRYRSFFDRLLAA